MTQPNLTELRKQQMRAAIDRLALALADGSARVVVGANGAVAFKGTWSSDGVTDLCAFRALKAAGNPALRKALLRAEIVAGRQIDQRAISAGVHSHDGGRSWHPGH
jgi:hypothetical protein